MGLFNLIPFSEACGCGAGTAIPAASSTIANFNPPMRYDSSLGSPTAQGLVPPFPAFPAQIYDSLGLQNGYGWNPDTGAWA